MSSYNELNALIDAYINRNGVQAITGQILNGVLKAMVEQIGRGYAIMGVADLATDPGTPDAPESWFASTPGTYTNFGGLVVADAEFALLSYTPSTGWAKTTLTEGITEITAGIDNNVGTPYVEATYQNGALEFQFYNLKGATGDPAGFGTVNATVDAGIGTPSVSVSGSGPDTARNYTFAFHNLKGETGVTSVVATVDNTTGNPSCAVSLVGQELHLDFSGLKGAQGDTGSSVDYPFTIVNNLTTDDATQALSAAQGVVLQGEITQLEHKVDENWKLPDTPFDISSFSNGYISTNGSYSTVVNAAAGTKCRNFDVQAGQKYKLYGTSASSGWYRLWAVFATDGTRLAICPSGDYTTTPAEVTIPEGGVHMTVNFYNYSSVTDKILLVGNVVDASTLQVEIEGNSFDIDVAKKQAEFSMENEMRSNPFSPILIDWMQLCHAKNGMTSVEQMSVVSATETALTLSSSDASAFANPSPAVVGFSDGSYKVVYFQASSGTTVERRDFETTDLTNAVTVQSLHDTVSGGYGIHLSAGGYLALGQFTAEQLIKRESQKDSNLITGANFYYCPSASNPSEIKDAGGRKICDITGTFDKNGQISGGIIAGWGIPSSGNQMYGYGSGWIDKCFQFDQNGNGKYLDLDFPCSGKGFVEIQCALLQFNNYFTGTAQMEVFADDTLLETNVLVYNQTMYRVNANVKRHLRIRFTLTSTASVYCLLYSVNFWRMPSFVPIPSFAGTKIAVLGDSWTQFPGPGAELEDHPDFNVLVTRPDGSEGGNGGYGYFPKELARVLNATVDNWGNGGKTAGNWGVPEIDTVLAFTDYDYVLIEFFINDFNAGDPIDKWVRNLKIICNRCIARGVRPIVIVPCLTNSAGLAGGTWHEYIMRGLMELPQ